jgi:phage gpG-like protein
MFGLTVQLDDQTSRVQDAAEKAAFRNLGHAAASIRKTAIDEIIVAEGPSDPGTPPHTRRRQLKRAIKYDLDQAAESALIGPEASIVGEAGAAHEFGGEFRGEDYPERPFMGPALETNVDRFASEWAGSIGE